MRNRIMALIAALAVVLAGGAAVLTLGGSAASAATASYSGARGWYIDANGIPRFLPTGPNAVPGQNGDYPNMWFKGFILDPQSAPVARAAVDSGVKREANLTVNVDFDASVPVKVTGLPAYRAGDPELWGDNTGSIPDAAADIVVRKVSTGVTVCPAAGSDGISPAATATNGLDKSRDVGSTEQKFCVYPRHASAVSSTWLPKFVAGQSYKLNIWVYAP